MLKASPANVPPLITIPVQEKALIVPRLSLLISFPPSPSGLKTSTPDLSLLHDQLTLPIGQSGRERRRF